MSDTEVYRLLCPRMLRSSCRPPPAIADSLSVLFLLCEGQFLVCLCVCAFVNDLAVLQEITFGVL